MMIVEPPKSTCLAASSLLTLAAGAFFLLGGEVTRPFWRESGSVENLSALAYFTGAVAAVLSAWRHRGLARLYLGLWAVFCLLCLGEETSWFQHFIHYHTPDAVAAHNAQGEFNLHNLEVFHGGHLTSKSSYSFSTLLKAQILFQIGFVAFFLLAPVLIRVKAIKELFGGLGIYIPSLKFIPFIWLPIGFSLVLSVLSAGLTKDGLAELREMMYAFSISCFLTMIYIRVRRPSPAASTEPV